MRNKIVMLLVIALVVISIVACSNKDKEDNADILNELDILKDVVSDISEFADKDEEVKISSSGLVGCGEVYTQGDISYSVIGVRKEEVEGADQIILKMEAYNMGDNNFNFSPMMNAELFDNKGNEGYFEFMSPAYNEKLLDGVILSGGNKIMGEIAFNISETKSDEFILQLGSMMETEKAIKITAGDIGKIFDELFENSVVSGEYSIGDTIEFENVKVTFDGVRIEPKNTYNSNYDEEGMGLMVLDMTMVNNSSQALEFISVSSFSTIRKVCTSDGTELKYEDYSYQDRNWVESGQTKSETFGLYYDESVKDFYLMLSPDLLNSESIKIMTFSIE